MIVPPVNPEAAAIDRAQRELVRECPAALPRDFLEAPVLVPSDIAEISRLQGQEGYVYLRL